MLESFKEKLQDPESTEHGALLSHVKGLISLSRKEMGKHYSTWDYNDSVFRSKRKVDKEDRAAAGKGQPTKMIVPLTFSQIMTFVSYNVMTLMQNRRFFELEPTGAEDNKIKEAVELVLERDVRRNSWTTFLVQFFLDVGRFSIGAAEVCYVEETRKIRVGVQENVNGAFGTESVKNDTGFVDVTTFLGNKIFPISPYRIFPDTRLPLTRYQEGEFMGSEDMFTVSSLQLDPECFNLDKIPKMTEQEHNDRRKISRIDVLETRAGQSDSKGALPSGEGVFETSGTVVVTKVCVDIVPKTFSKRHEVDFGEEEFPIRYIVWYANDRTIVKAEEAYYLHGMFPYVLAQYLNDQHQTINESLAEVSDQITNLITWMVNARVTNIRGAIDSKFIVDPSAIDVKSLESRSPWIFLKKGMAQTGVERYMQQFQVNDNATAMLIQQDIPMLKGLLGESTGYNETMHGQYSQGRRSATQDRVVAQSGSARGKTVLASIWDKFFEPMGKQLIANNRNDMDQETFQRILGAGYTEELWLAYKATPQEIAASEDFFVFDGTLPSEKAFLAQSLQELLMTMLSNPQVAMIMGYGPEQFQQLLEDIYNLRGVTPARLPARPPAAPSAPAILPMPMPQTEPAAI